MTWKMSMPVPPISPAKRGAGWTPPRGRKRRGERRREGRRKGRWRKRKKSMRW